MNFISSIYPQNSKVTIELHHINDKIRAWLGSREQEDNVIEYSKLGERGRVVRSPMLIRS